MQILGKQKITAFMAKHADSRKALTTWLADVERENWQTSHDIKAVYQTADFLADNRVIFNIRGNHYRLVVKVRYINGIVRIEWIGTHAEYSKKEF
ncbi:type II toxin-antitoxin system HigB family toxin [Neisseria sp. ZJ106]|uniref:Type II toxin-antitoxin system HigB family toxin n=1 Tax=Neisseria lisongii TaxID=2912188 RepID=A0ABY7RLH6_9NEIS|nr:type II toxin-antitoxin system HigB family toxin [Neisseria lisongii]MCF7520456.1 type II toxin-antitoxin system HigB family toxin [Neisseria lisongii]WCL71601.1 type II toxin-antitoxin system HigB family toxin [Neisseria lisongii]